METSESCVSQPDSVGFLSVIEIGNVGYCGGYLVLNSSGRPVEFHCTLPVNPDRAQRILYGKSLEPFLFAEHIGKPLLEKSRMSPAIVFVEQAPLLDLQTRSATPLIHVWATQPAIPSVTEFSQDSPPNEPDKLESNLGFRSGVMNDSTNTLVESLERTIDLLEPFERIRQALHEAHSVRAA